MRVLPVVLLIAAVAVGGYWAYRSFASALEAQQGGGEPPAVAVEFAEVTEGTASEDFSTVGEIVAADRVTLTAQSSGTVTDIPVSDGARVSEGEVLVRLDDQAQQAALASAEADLAEA